MNKNCYKLVQAYLTLVLDVYLSNPSTEVNTRVFGLGYIINGSIMLEKAHDNRSRVGGTCFYVTQRGQTFRLGGMARNRKDSIYAHLFVQNLDLRSSTKLLVSFTHQ